MLQSKNLMLTMLVYLQASAIPVPQAHVDGKKHRAKARGFHVANQPIKSIEEPAQDAKDVTGDPPTIEFVENKVVDESKKEDTNLDLSLKKRKLEILSDFANGSDQLSKVEAVTTKKAKAEKPVSIATKSKDVDILEEVNEDASIYSKELKVTKIKWKKLITTFLKLNPDKILKLRKLQKLVMKSLEESGVTKDEAQHKESLLNKLNLSSRF